METRKFSPLYVGQLKISHLIGLNTATIDVASPLQKDFNTLAVAAFNTLVAINAQLDKCLKHPFKSLITPELKQFDKSRDGNVDEIKREVRVASKSSDTVKANAGKILLNFLQPFWNTPQWAMNTETALISEILIRIEIDPVLTTSVATLGLTGLFATLKTVNTSFKTLYLERLAEYANKSEPAGKFKQEAVVDYENFCTVIELSVNLTPEPMYVSLFDLMDNIRKVYHSILAKSEDEPVETLKEE
jgi:hypothetical protein